jgi:catechol 2,3-dioxygenase-like lactoylglutathione lyase family enzyme
MKIEGIIETAIYVPDLDAAQPFYEHVLGLRLIGKDPAHHVFFQVGDQSILLLFLAEATLRGDILPAHGAKGPGHLALGIQPQSLDGFRQRLRTHAVPIEKEVDWPRGGKSIYFRDPAGNLVELITPGVWGLPSGW